MDARAHQRLFNLERQLAAIVARTFINYSKGTYVPTYTGVTTAGVTTYTAQDGFWTRVGRIVFFNGRVTWTAATGTGNAAVSLPAQSSNTAGMRYSSGSVRLANVTFANSAPEMRIEAGQTFFTMDSPLTNAATAIVQMEAAGDIIFGGWYNIIN